MANLFRVVLAFENDMVNNLSSYRGTHSLACGRGSGAKHHTGDKKEGVRLNTQQGAGVLGNKKQQHILLNEIATFSVTT